MPSFTTCEEKSVKRRESKRSDSNSCGLELESRLWSSGFKLVAGVDEAGRGALAGPLVAAAVILKENSYIDGLKDSKLLSPSKRELLFEMISGAALAWSVVRIDHRDIDERGLQWANKTALVRAIDSLSVRPDFVLSDAFPLDGLAMPRLAVVKGDRFSASIAAASIIAKVTRDRIMLEYHASFPKYRFNEHKGYATKDHKSLLDRYGPCPIHRRCFSPIKRA